MNDVTIVIEKNSQGDDILTAMLDRQICFHSTYDKEEYARNWSKLFDKANFQTVSVVVGVADGIYLRKIREKNKDMIIVAYEPSEDIMEYFASLPENQSLLEDERVYILSGKDGLQNSQRLLYSVIDYVNYKNVIYAISPNYELVFSEEIERIKKNTEYAIDRVQVNRNTMKRFGIASRNNVAKNICDVIEQSVLVNMFVALDDIDKEKVPIVIIASGPSLDKNIHLLKEVKNKFVLVACDSALKALAKAGVVPDVIVTVDPEKHLEVFEHEMMNDIPLVMDVTSNYRIRELHHGKHFYMCTNASIMDLYFDKYGIFKINLETGGSVANTAFSMAISMGFRNVIFVGQDLAYPNDQQHAQGAYEDVSKNVLSEDKEYFYVDDIYGNKVKTEFNMDLYRRWFEQMIGRYDFLRCIDATEGGALIKGTEIRSFQEVMDEFLPQLSELSVPDLLHHATETFTEEQKQEIYKDLGNLNLQMSDIRKKARNGIASYEKLLEYTRKQIYAGAGFTKTISEITEVNHWVSEAAEVKFMADYTYDADYSVMEVLSEETEDSGEDFSILCNNGIRTLQALIEATGVVEKEYADVIEYARKKL